LHTRHKHNHTILSSTVTSTTGLYHIMTNKHERQLLESPPKAWHTLIRILLQTTRACYICILKRTEGVRTPVYCWVNLTYRKTVRGFSRAINRSQMGRKRRQNSSQLSPGLIINVLIVADGLTLKTTRTHGPLYSSSIHPSQ
jgi:hypothetical protein